MKEWFGGVLSAGGKKLCLLLGGMSTTSARAMESATAILMGNERSVKEISSFAKKQMPLASIYLERKKGKRAQRLSPLNGWKKEGIDADRRELFMANIVTAKELGQYLKLSESTIYKLASDGNIPGFKIGDSWRFDMDEIFQLIRKGMKRNNKKKKNNE